MQLEIVNSFMSNFEMAVVWKLFTVLAKKTIDFCISEILITLRGCRPFMMQVIYYHILAVIHLEDHFYVTSINCTYMIYSIYIQHFIFINVFKNNDCFELFKCLYLDHVLKIHSILFALLIIHSYCLLITCSIIGRCQFYHIFTDSLTIYIITIILISVL